MTWRDDDISYQTKLETFMRVHEIFIKYKVLHTVAVIAKDIDKAPALIDYIKSNNIEVQLHCWDHVDLPGNHHLLTDHFSAGIASIKKNFGIVPTVLYPPWNKTDDTVKIIAADFGMQVSAEKISLSAYIRTGGKVVDGVINFHYWAQHETDLLDEALHIYTSRKQS